MTRRRCFDVREEAVSSQSWLSGPMDPRICNQVSPAAQLAGCCLIVSRSGPARWRWGLGRAAICSTSICKDIREHQSAVPPSQAIPDCHAFNSRSSIARSQEKPLGQGPTLPAGRVGRTCPTVVSQWGLQHSEQLSAMCRTSPGHPMVISQWSQP